MDCGYTYETPTGAAESCPLELDGGDDGTVKVRVAAAATPHVKRDETRTDGAMLFRFRMFNFL